MVAIDGDRGRPNRLVYSLVNGESGAALGTGPLLTRAECPAPLGPSPSSVGQKDKTYGEERLGPSRRQ